ncbi:hypothetical protein LQG66_07175 [Bradyrhizobium ontarionense]|uniref:Uncharacterized protein n=1 Tax=Bradyrhizobium ontarionense TaxID=2898149 RepID=A0ABY3RG91_9BRAD|nr:hypothetical protein [Bradyrhizobium sp. A19]UFZ06077.1 hypothetical protein LQG66_07175 [Bradyrhizobium sp. A19]
MRHVVLAAVLSVSPALAQTAVSQGPITCSSPVAADDSAKSLMLRHGNEAVIQDGLFSGVEDITYKGLVLHPHSPEWRIEVFFADETMSRAARLTLHDTKSGHWNVAGVTLGATLAEVQKINGKPFLVSEFDSDFSGFVVDWKGGVLGRPLPGGCMLVVRFGRNSDGGAPGGNPISSNNAKLLKWGPVVEQIEVRFPDK